MLTYADSIVRILPGGAALVVILGPELGRRSPACSRCGKPIAHGLVPPIGPGRPLELVGVCCERPEDRGPCV